MAAIMSATVTMDDTAGASPSEGADYISAERGLLSWLTTVDHKRIGLMYLASVLHAFVLGRRLRLGGAPRALCRPGGRS